MNDPREETKSRRWLAIYGAVIALQVQEYCELTSERPDVRYMKHFIEEAEAIADLEIEAGVELNNER